jgi:hypothetical protein
VESCERSSHHAKGRLAARSFSVSHLRGRLHRPNQIRIRRNNDEQGSGVDPSDVWLTGVYEGNGSILPEEV